MIPLNTPVSFKYIELGADGRLVGWGQDICAGGGNMTVLVEPAQQLISAYKVTVDPPMSASEWRWAALGRRVWGLAPCVAEPKLPVL